MRGAKVMEANSLAVQLCQPDRTHTGLMFGQIIADLAHYRHHPVTSNLQCLPHFKCGRSGLGRSIDYCSSGAMSPAEPMGLYAGEMYQPGRIQNSKLIDDD